MSRLFWCFLYTAVGRWVSCLITGGWCFIKKDDPRWVVSTDEHSILFKGDTDAAPDKGISTQRSAWKTWIFFHVLWAEEKNYGRRYVVIDTYDDKRMICVWKTFNNQVVGIRAGYEDGVVRLAIRQPEGHPPPDEITYLSMLVPKYLGRWEDDGGIWSIALIFEGVKKEDVTFL